MTEDIDEYNQQVEEYNKSIDKHNGSGLKSEKSINHILVVTDDGLPTIYVRAYLNGNELVIALNLSKKDPEDRYGIPNGSKFLIQADSRKMEKKK